MGKLILMRHGKSSWNVKNIFTGWVDVPLSMEGIEEALRAGQQLEDTKIDIAFISTLTRASMTLMIALACNKVSGDAVILHPEDPKISAWEKCYSKKTWDGILPVHVAWQLNERMYGELQGRDKKEVEQEVGKEQFVKWRRGYDTPPPSGESLKDTIERVVPYFTSSIVPHLNEGKTIAISAHGNSLRALIMHLDNISTQDIVSLEIPTGEPILYDWRKEGPCKI